MKFLRIFILFLLFPDSIYACHCPFLSDEPLSVTVSHYDFIAHIKIRSVRSGFTTKEHGSDFAQIEIIELFKGNKADSLHIWGIGTSCDMGVTSGDEWLIFGSSSGNSYTTNSCTHSYKIRPRSSWQTDSPFFTQFLYKLKKFYHHPLSLPLGGNHNELFPDRTIKSYYRIVNNKLEGDYYYMTESKQAYFYTFRNGEPEGDAYYFAQDAKWFSITKYKDGEVTEMTEYKTEDSLFPFTTPLNKQIIDSLISRPKRISFHRQYLPDHSQITKIWNTKRGLYSIEQKDSTGKILFSIRYFEDGSIAGSSIVDPNTGIDTYTGYFEGGIIERKLIRYPNKKETIYYYNRDGSLKKEITREDNKTIYSKEY